MIIISHYLNSRGVGYNKYSREERISHYTPYKTNIYTGDYTYRKMYKLHIIYIKTRK